MLQRDIRCSCSKKIIVLKKLLKIGIIITLNSAAQEEDLQDAGWGISGEFSILLN